MNGSFLILIFLLFLQIPTLNTQDRTGRREGKRRHRNKLPDTNSKRWNILKKQVTEEISNYYSKRLDDLEEQINRFKLKTKEELKRCKQSCPDGYIKFQSRCFRFIMSRSSWRSWSDARDFCQDNGANLVSLKSARKLKFIHNHLTNNFQNHTDSVFSSGIYANPYYEYFRWPATDMVHMKWRWEGKRKPLVGNATLCEGTIPREKDIKDMNACLILARTCDWYLTAGKCSTPRPFICEIEMDKKRRRRART